MPETPHCVDAEGKPEGGAAPQYFTRAVAKTVMDSDVSSPTALVRSSTFVPDDSKPAFDDTVRKVDSVALSSHSNTLFHRFKLQLLHQVLFTD